MKTNNIFFLCLLSVLLTAAGCSKDDDDEAVDEGPDTSNECVPELPTGATPDGGTCMEIDDCVSGYCSANSHTPTNTDAVCQPAPPLGDVHALANVRDFRTNELMPNVSVKIGGALDLSQNPTGFPVTDTLVSDATGFIDAVLTGDSTKLLLGIMAVVEAEGYYPTSTGLLKPEAGCGVYPAGIRNPDIKMIKETDITELSNLLLSSYPELSEQLPLGDKGGVAGLIRDVNSGEEIAGAEIRSTRATSSAQIYYLNEAEDGFNQDATGSSSIFVIIQPGLAEEFEAFQNGASTTRIPATIGETVGILLTTTIQVE